MHALNIVSYLLLSFRNCIFIFKCFVFYLYAYKSENITLYREYYYLLYLYFCVLYIFIVFALLFLSHFSIESQTLKS